MKRLRFLTWLLPVLFCLIGLFYFRHIRSEGQGRKTAGATSPSPAAKPAPSKRETMVSASTAPLPLLGLPQSKTTNAVVALADAAREARLKYRLSNTTRTVNDLAHSDRAILLENALMDTARPVNFSIPDNLRAEGDPGAYIVQARGPIDDTFRSVLNAAGADIVSYIPNNAFLVRASATVAQQLAASPWTQTVLPYEPYYKVSPPLLDAIMKQQALPPGGMITVVVFPGQEAPARNALQPLVAGFVSQDRSPFGPVLTVLPRPGSLSAIARLPVVESIGITSKRATANDLSRAFVGVAADSITQSNYLNLSGSNVLVQVVDSGVDATNPDLFPRVFGTPLQDTDGHGTHVAGIIAGSGLESLSVTNAIGSIMPATTNQFRGKAPAANLYVQPLDMTDFDLQESAALTNALISNNSWNYSSQDYDIFAASYDAAVRDSLPLVTGSQPVLFVFSAGNSGAGNDEGTGGDPESIQSPATGKNVITVGALEQPRNVTNNVVVDGQTNQPWAQMTDSENEVASFSSRGNVGIGIEGDFGRFKPDVVAPGVFVVSTRSQQWDTNAYYNPTNYSFNTELNQVVDPNGFNFYDFPVPNNAVGAFISVYNLVPTNVTSLAIYANSFDFPTTNDFLGLNFVSLPITGIATTWFYSIGNFSNMPVQYDLTTELVTTNDNGDYFQVLQGLNDSLGSTNGHTYYRYETGTSMAAADVSGTLALIKDFFTNTLQEAPSPALLKAILINGARSVNNKYSLQVQNAINYQGWGAINLPNCIPSSLVVSNSPSAVPNLLTNGPSPILFYDQNSQNALATGDRATTYVTLSPAARTEPLRVTVVWTDPPGNPMAGVKLVNDLDLVVTNLDSGDVFLGNDFSAGANFNFAWNTNSVPNVDVINNVENVYLAPNLGANYSITVIGRRVNVNAVTTNPVKVAQDFALVISSDSHATDALTWQSGTGGLTSANSPFVTSITNQFATIPDISGQLLLGQHVGASSPLQGNNFIPLTNTIWATNGQITLGVTNQWHFYVLTNFTGFTNAAFATFLPLNLAPARMGVTNVDSPQIPTNAVRPEADIDLYVAGPTVPNASGLTNLDPAVLDAADKSVTRGGTEVIVYTNAVQGTYYVGVKSEDQEAAEYAFLGIFSEFAFSTMDNGVETIRGINVPAPIPDGSPALPGAAPVVAIGVQPITIQRVVVTNTITHENFGDLLGNLSHNRQFAVLNNHSFGNGNLTQTDIYEDNGQNDIPGSKHTDGPGSLVNFMGGQGAGLWLLTEVDNALTHTGRVDSLFIRVDPDLGGGGGTNTLVIQPNSFTYFSIDVPIQATNLVISFLNVSTTPLPLQVFMERGALPTQATFDYTQTINPPGGVLAVSTASLPPLQPGRYFVGIFNPNLVPQTVDVSWIVFLNPNPIAPLTFTSDGPAPIPDDAVTYSTITITNFPSTVTIADIAVGVSIIHPRVSDLVLTLISPSGERFLLFENRGGPNTANMGASLFTTNYFGTQIAGGFNANTNVIGPVPTQGTLLINYDFFTIPDTIDVYYDGVRLPGIPTGPISGAGTFNVPYGPGVGNSITIIMNQGGNTNNPTTQWIYTPAVISQSPSYFTFTDNTNKTLIPVKYQIPPFDNTASATTLNLGRFDGIAEGDYVPPSMVNSFSVISNQVSVVNDPPNAQTPPKFLALANGVISNTLPVTPGSQYNLTYAYRGPGIAAWWRFESSLDDIISGNVGTATGNPLFGPGEVGDGLSFNGVSDYVSVPASTSLNVGAGGGMTIEGWINPTDVSSEHPLLEWNDGTNINTHFWISVPFTANPGSLYANFVDTNNASHGITSSAGLLTTNTWQHVAVTYNKASGLAALYVNGLSVTQQNLGFFTPNTTSTLYFGYRPAGIDAFNHYPGAMDEMSIYNRALSPSEIKAIYTDGTAGKFSRAGLEPGSPIIPPQNLAEAQAVLGGIRTDTLFGNNTNWQIWNTSFTPTTPTVPLTITGVEPGMLLDTFRLTQIPGPIFVLPEETLHDLIGQSPDGTWTLEIQDDRAGDQGTLTGWQLQFILSTNVTTTVNLTNGVTSTNGIPPCQFQYYIVQVPSWAAFVTNLLISATAPVNVWFNQTVPPTGTNAGDFELITAATSGSSTLFTNGVPPNLIPGATYYLGVENPCSNGSNVTVQVQVDFGANVIRLTNMVAYANTNSGSNILNDYYVFYVPTNAARAQFEIDNPTGNMELVARKGLPPPDPFSFDYFSDNPGTNDELITVFTNSSPVALSAGDWYLTAINLSGTQVNYSIMASWWPTTGEPITVTNVTISSNSFCITWTSLPFVHYFIQGVTNLTAGMTWTTIVPDILGASNATTTTYCIPLPSPYHFFRVGEGLVLSFPTLGGGTAVTNTIPPCQTSDFAVDVPPNASFAANMLLSATAPVNIWFNQTGRPNRGANPGDYELLTNVTSGSFTLTSNSVPPLVPGARYYLGVENPCVNNTNVTVVLQVDFGQNIITLTNMVSYANANAGTNANDYYVFNVPANAARAQFEIDNPSAYVALVASEGVPPDLFSYDYISANPGTNDQLIVVFTNSIPVPLAAGSWYLTAINLSGGPVTYSIMASWWPTTGQPINITGTTFSPGNFCITWDSLADVHYYIEGVPSLTAGMTWTVVSPDIIGTGASTSYCIPLPSPYHFFRIVEGIAPNIPPLTVTVIRVAGVGFQLQWTGPVTAKYQVEWSPSLASPVWTPFGNVITSNTGQFSFLDDGSQTGGLGATRFYRVIQLP